MITKNKKLLTWAELQDKLGNGRIGNYAYENPKYATVYVGGNKHCITLGALNELKKVYNHL